MKDAEAGEGPANDGKSGEGRGKGGEPRGERAKRRQEAPLAPEEIAGLDPETCEVVMRGTKRDRELGQKYAWWNNRCSIG